MGFNNVNNIFTKLKKIRKVFKYGTGQPIPKGAIYLSTQVEKNILVNRHSETGDEQRSEVNTFVWHYFLVLVNENEKDK